MTEIATKDDDLMALVFGGGNLSAVGTTSHVTLTESHSESHFSQVQTHVSSHVETHMESHVEKIVGGRAEEHSEVHEVHGHHEETNGVGITHVVEMHSVDNGHDHHFIAHEDVASIVRPESRQSQLTDVSSVHAGEYNINGGMDDESVISDKTELAPFRTPQHDLVIEQFKSLHHHNETESESGDHDDVHAERRGTYTEEMTIADDSHPDPIDDLDRQHELERLRAEKRRVEELKRSLVAHEVNHNELDSGAYGDAEYDMDDDDGGISVISATHYAFDDTNQIDRVEAPMKAKRDSLDLYALPTDQRLHHSFPTVPDSLHEESEFEHVEYLAPDEAELARKSSERKLSEIAAPMMTSEVHVDVSSPMMSESVFMSPISPPTAPPPPPPMEEHDDLILIGGGATTTPLIGTGVTVQRQDSNASSFVPRHEGPRIRDSIKAVVVDDEDDDGHIVGYGVSIHKEDTLIGHGVSIYREETVVGHTHHHEETHLNHHEDNHSHQDLVLIGGGATTNPAGRSASIASSYHDTPVVERRPTTDSVYSRYTDVRVSHTPLTEAVPEVSEHLKEELDFVSGVRDKRALFENLQHQPYEKKHTPPPQRSLYNDVLKMDEELHHEHVISKAPSVHSVASVPPSLPPSLPPPSVPHSVTSSHRGSVASVHSHVHVAHHVPEHEDYKGPTPAFTHHIDPYAEEEAIRSRNTTMTLVESVRSRGSTLTDQKANHTEEHHHQHHEHHEHHEEHHMHQEEQHHHEEADLHDHIHPHHPEEKHHSHVIHEDAHRYVSQPVVSPVFIPTESGTPDNQLPVSALLTKFGGGNKKAYTRDELEHRRREEEQAAAAIALAAEEAHDTRLANLSAAQSRRSTLMSDHTFVSEHSGPVPHLRHRDSVSSVSTVMTSASVRAARVAARPDPFAQLPHPPQQKQVAAGYSQNPMTSPSLKNPSNDPNKFSSVRVVRNVRQFVKTWGQTDFTPPARSPTSPNLAVWHEAPPAFDYDRRGSSASVTSSRLGQENVIGGGAIPVIQEDEEHHHHHHEHHHHEQHEHHHHVERKPVVPASLIGESGESILMPLQQRRRLYEEAAHEHNYHNGGLPPMVDLLA